MMKTKRTHSVAVSMGEQSKSFDLYAPIDHKVIDSAAFADLSHSAVRVLNIIARQWNSKNNGWLHATFTYCHERGIGSEHTLQAAIESLIAHGFIYRTRSHGMVDGENIAARYAITWRPLCGKQHRNGLFLDGFLPNAFEKWEPEKNSDPQELQGSACKNSSFKRVKLHKLQDKRPAKSADFEIFAIKGGVSSEQDNPNKGSLAYVEHQRKRVIVDLIRGGRSSLCGLVLNYRPTIALPFAHKPPKAVKPCSLAA